MIRHKMRGKPINQDNQGIQYLFWIKSGSTSSQGRIWNRYGILIQ